MKGTSSIFISKLYILEDCLKTNLLFKKIDSGKRISREKSDHTEKQEKMQETTSRKGINKCVLHRFVIPARFEISLPRFVISLHRFEIP